MCVCVYTYAHPFGTVKLLYVCVYIHIHIFVCVKPV